MIVAAAAVFNPKILDASIRDVSSYLSDNQKVDLLLYAMRSFPFEGRSRTVIENAIQSCLQVSTLSSENVAKARILRARARLANGLHVGAQEDLHAALAAEPDNPEAKALLHQRSVTVEKLLSPIPKHNLKERVSNEIWREIALHLPKRDLKALLFVPHPLSRIASQLLFWELDLHFTGAADGEAVDENGSPGVSGLGLGIGSSVMDGGFYHTGTGHHGGLHHRDRDLSAQRDDDASHAQRSADILTRIITDPIFASAVRTLRIYAFRRDREGSIAFQTGMLMNALPRLINLRNVHLSSTSDGIVPVLRILQRTSPRLRGLSLKSPDSPADLSFLEFRHLTHFAYATSALSPSSSGAPPPATAAFHALLAQNKTTLRTIALDLSSAGPSSPSVSALGSMGGGMPAISAFSFSSAHWTFPSAALSVRNLTSIYFTGTVPANSLLFSDILTNGRQLETLDIACGALECPHLSSQVRGVAFATPHALPFLRHFALSVASLGRRVTDRDLFPSVAEFLRGRRQLRSLHLVVQDEAMQPSVGFDAACWGVLPSLDGLKGLKISYPADLAPGLASWLIPRTVLALRLTLDYTCGAARDPIPFLSQLRHGIPPTLRFIGLTDINVRNPALVVEHGFPMVRVVRIGNNYWTVHRNGASNPSSSSPRASNTNSNTAPSSSSSSAASSPALGGSAPNAGSTTGSPRAHTSTASLRTVQHGHHVHIHPHPNTKLAASGSASASASGLQQQPLHAGRGHGHHGHGHALGGGSTSGMGSTSIGGSGGVGGAMLMNTGEGVGGRGGMGSAGMELEQWPRRRAMYHALEWLEWLGCEDAMIRDPSAFAG